MKKSKQEQILSNVKWTHLISAVTAKYSAAMDRLSMVGGSIGNYVSKIAQQANMNAYQCLAMVGSSFFICIQQCVWQTPGYKSFPVGHGQRSFGAPAVNKTLGQQFAVSVCNKAISKAAKITMWLGAITIEQYKKCEEAFHSRRAMKEDLNNPKKSKKSKKKRRYSTIESYAGKGLTGRKAQEEFEKKRMNKLDEQEKKSDIDLFNTEAFITVNHIIREYVPDSKGWMIFAGSNLRKQLEEFGFMYGQGGLIITEISDINLTLGRDHLKILTLKLGESAFSGLKYTGTQYDLNNVNAVFGIMLTCGTYADLGNFLSSLATGEYSRNDWTPIVVQAKRASERANENKQSDAVDQVCAFEAAVDSLSDAAAIAHLITSLQYTLDDTQQLEVKRVLGGKHFDWDMFYRGQQISMHSQQNSDSPDDNEDDDLKQNAGATHASQTQSPFIDLSQNVNPLLINNPPDTTLNLLQIDESDIIEDHDMEHRQSASEPPLSDTTQLLSTSQTSDNSTDPFTETDLETLKSKASSLYCDTECIKYYEAITTLLDDLTDNNGYQKEWYGQTR